MLGCAEGSLDGSPETEDWPEGVEDGSEDALGELDGIDDGSPEMLGLEEGSLDGAADREGDALIDGFCEGWPLGLLDGKVEG